jgi:type IX secretion system PorP/SprF family membrane protein
MKKVNILFALFLMSSLFVNAQQMPHFSQYMFNDLYLNPAVAGSKDQTELKLTLRNQWAGFDDAPKTQTLSFQTNYIENMGLGAILINDKTGPLNQTGIELTYAYHIRISGESKLSLGLSAKAIQYVFDERKLTLEDTDDNAILGIVDKTLVPDASFGAYYYNPKYYIGLSIPQLFQSGIRYDGSENRINKEIRHYFLTAGYTVEITDDLAIEPSVLVKTVLKSPAQLDINVKGTYKDMFWLGFSYRHKDASVAMLGMEFDKLTLGYAYDFTMSNVRKYSAGSHEIMLGMIIDTKDIKKNKSSTKFR